MLLSARMEKATDRKIFFFSYGTVLTAILISLLQGFFFALDGQWTFYNVAAIGLAAVNCFLGIKFLLNQSTQLLARVILLYFAQLAFFAVRLIGIEPTSAPRLLEVALLLLHAAVVVSMIISRFRITVWPVVMLVSVIVAALIFVSETVLPSGVKPSPKPVATRDWATVAQWHPVLETVYRPSSVHKVFYSENPHDYFSQPDGGKTQWWFRTGGNAEAEVIHGADSVRVNIKKAESKTPYDIQLNLTHLKVESGRPYKVQFRARSDRPRSIFVGFSRSHEPWTGLGLYNKIELNAEWQNFGLDFTSTAEDSNARIHFDIGESDIPVEFSEVKLLRMPEGKPVNPVRSNYFVDYRFNALGCRGPDYSIPKPAGSRRILILGDSAAMGAGVHEKDTLSEQMQSLLKKSYEVINCGVDDYGVQQDRLFYKFLAGQYQPDLVVLVLTRNANRTVLEEFNKKEPLFHTWASMRIFLNPYNFSASLDEILQLNRRLKNDDSKLLVVSFRNNSDYAGSTEQGKQWNELTRAVSKELDDANIPWLDLDKALHSKNRDRDLMVLPPGDDRPNHVAHAIAAQEILRFLQKKGLM